MKMPEMKTKRKQNRLFIERYTTLLPFTIYLLTFAGVSGCNWKLKATYKSDHVASDLKKMCRKDYGLMSKRGTWEARCRRHC